MIINKFIYFEKILQLINTLTNMKYSKFLSKVQNKILQF